MQPTSEIVRTAVDEARKSTHRFRVGAVVYDRKYIMGQGFNNAVKTHPRSPHPFKTIHAEFAAILSALVRIDSEILYNKSVYVHRLRADYSPGLAKPCVWCFKMFSQLGIRDIHWSV